jgi:hypothetical protein
VRVLLTALALLASLLLAHPRAAAADPRIPAPSAPAGIVAAGTELTTVLGPLPAGIHEVELYLVTDDGERFLRVSSETEARSGEIHWRMPRIHAHTARLVLRAGSEHGEWESAPSAEFTVSDGAKDAAGQLAAAIAGRLDDSSPLAAKDTLPCGWRSTRGDAELQTACVLDGAAEAPRTRDADLPPVSAVVVRVIIRRTTAIPSSAPSTLDSSPSQVPLRI